jgi:hypothetical protein
MIGGSLRRAKAANLRRQTLLTWFSERIAIAAWNGNVHGKTPEKIVKIVTNVRTLKTSVGIFLIIALAIVSTLSSWHVQKSSGTETISESGGEI